MRTHVVILNKGKPPSPKTKPIDEQPKLGLALSGELSGATDEALRRTAVDFVNSIRQQCGLPPLPDEKPKK